MENGLICFHLLKSRTCGLNEEFRDKVRESEFPVCIWKAIDSWWLCKIVIAVSLWWVSVLARQGTECWKIQAAAWGAWSHTVHLNAWLEGLRLRPVCYVCVSCPLRQQWCMHFSWFSQCSLFPHLSFSFSDSVYISLFCGCVSVCESVCAYIQMHMDNLYMFIFPCTPGI